MQPQQQEPGGERGGGWVRDSSQWPLCTFRTSWTVTAQQAVARGSPSWCRGRWPGRSPWWSVWVSSGGAWGVGTKGSHELGGRGKSALGLRSHRRGQVWLRMGILLGTEWVETGQG